MSGLRMYVEGPQDSTDHNEERCFSNVYPWALPTPEAIVEVIALKVIAMIRRGSRVTIVVHETFRFKQVWFWISFWVSIQRSKIRDHSGAFRNPSPKVDVVMSCSVWYPCDDMILALIGMRDCRNHRRSSLTKSCKTTPAMELFQ